MAKETEISAALWSSWLRKNCVNVYAVMAVQREIDGVTSAREVRFIEAAGVIKRQSVHSH